MRPSDAEEPMEPDPLREYYALRASEYERIYAKPERQDDLRRLERHVARLMADRDVLEIACGTGYWTRVIATSARSIVATDAGEEVLEIARRNEASRVREGGATAIPGEPSVVGRPTERDAASARTAPAACGQPLMGNEPPARDDPGQAVLHGPLVAPTFFRADAFDLDAVEGRFNAAFAGYWWSHIPRDAIARFLGGLHARLGPGCRVLFIDNRYVEGSSTPISRTDDRGNTYQVRRLDGGSEHEVLKNFPAPAELRAALPGSATAVEILELRYFRALSYETGLQPLVSGRSRGF